MSKQRKPTRGAFGKQPVPERKEIEPRKLAPPVQVRERMTTIENERLHSNPIIKAIQKFFFRDGF